MNHFFAYMSRMKNIRRWSLMRNISEENIQEHSQQVAMIAHALGVIANRIYGKKANLETVLALAVFHEAGEVITGDLPTPIKYFNPQISSAYKDIEKIACSKLLQMLPGELQEDYEPLLLPKDSFEKKLVKAADRICAYTKCLEELRAGNAEFEKAAVAVRKTIDEMKLPEVTYFMEHFVPSFSLTLDELN
ncbi:MAG: 5'-deoxynucleotidase [Eubacteriales bacterium]|nr:5'-deoxynucleotidase [Eubacteriales bacterium]